MAELKTKQVSTSVAEFLKTITDEQKQKDSRVLLELMKKITKETPKLWGNGTIGFGTFHYKSERSRQEGDWYMSGFAPRKQNLTVYIMSGFGEHKDLMKKLGKHKTGGGCLYINKLVDIDLKVLQEIITRSHKSMKEKYKK